MFPAPEWLSEALKGRFDTLTARTRKIQEIRNLSSKSAAAFGALMNEAGPEGKKRLLDWEEISNRAHALEMEFVYLRGVQDGVQVLFSLLNDNENNSLH